MASQVSFVYFYGRKGMNLRLDIEYDGSLYAGWQIQPDALSVQEAIEKALKTVLRRKVKVTGAGRTDAGVHATGQVAHFTVEDLPVSLDTLTRSLNGLLKEGITIRAVSAAPDDFHARYSAQSRTYVYSLSKVKRSIDRNRFFTVVQPLDLEQMRHAAARLLGRHDFRNFSVAKGEKSTLCTVKELVIDETEREILIRIRADRFLHRMVRMIVGLLLEIGRGRLSSDYIDEAFADRNLKRKKGFAVPPQGLCLTEVAY